MTQSPISLDSWQVIDAALRPDDRLRQNWNFHIRDGNILLLNRSLRRSCSAGVFLLRIMWPRRAKDIVPGFAVLAHPTWETLPLIIPLAGIPTAIPQDRDWRFICPIRKTLEQILYLDSESTLFVSRKALGRRQRRSDFARILRALEQILRLEEKHGALDEIPPNMSPRLYSQFKDAREALYFEWNLAFSGVPEDILDSHGFGKFIATSRVRSTKRAAGQTYFLDKKGSLKMSATLKKRLGIL